MDALLSARSMSGMGLVKAASRQASALVLAPVPASRRKCSAVGAFHKSMPLTESFQEAPATHVDVQACCRRSALLIGVCAAVTLPLRGTRGSLVSGGKRGADGGAWASDLNGSGSNVLSDDLVAFVVSNATRGDTESVLRAIDTFNHRFPLHIIGPEKGAMLESLMRSSRPKRVVQLGVYAGYSTIRMARCLPPGGTLVCIEPSKDAVERTTEVLKYAGLWGSLPDGRSVIVEQGRTEELLQRLADTWDRPAELVFEDHCKGCYLPDLLTMESSGLVDKGTLLVADNVVHPGTPEFLRYLRAPENGYAAAMVPARQTSGSQSDALAVAVKGLPRSDNSQLAVALNSAVGQLPQQNGSMGAFGSRSSEALRRAASKLRDSCNAMPNGKRCAPIPARYSL